MQKISQTIVLLLGICFFSQWANAQQGLRSPEQFLGYKPGSKFTRHHRIVEYAKEVALVKPEMVRLEKYGETIEGRELMIAIISSPENMQRLNSIRSNQLKLAGLTSDNTGAQAENAPAIVWLSYNVHGNEASSSESFMLTLYALADPSNSLTKEWLRNTVIILDPCMNPDGRDRYINWYNSVAGDKMNIQPDAREHNEPWPSGRGNHYYFDLNRDWAWQVQAETKLRMKKYNEWMPQVHVDYHEQGYNESYYFAPAADPVHEVVTPWQKELQVMIGKNHAKYFDKNNWLFFTKERFDLLYPSYGDTYPMYNGAIGMTYEQGGIAAGLGVLKDDNDTLTLSDRIAHHYTTAISTIEVVSKNRQKIIQEFVRFFADGKFGKVGEYKTIVFTANDENKLAALKKIMEQDGITCGSLNTKNFRGYNYFTGREEIFTDEGYHLAVSLMQPKAVLAKVLLEPKTFIKDSNTYDITAWSVAFAYGIKAYAVKEPLSLSPLLNNTPVVNEVTGNYGLLIPYTSFNGARVLASLLKQGIKIRFAEKPIVYKSIAYPSGTLIVLKTGNPTNWLAVANEACKKMNIQPVAVETGWMEEGVDFGSSGIRNIASSPKILLITGEQTSSLASGEIWHFMDRLLDYPVTMLDASRLGYVHLNDYQIVILPDGGYKILNDKVQMDRLKSFVHSGGKLIAMESAVQLLARSEWGIKLKDEKEKKTVADTVIKKYADREKEYLTNSVSGAIYKIELDNTHPLAFGYPNYYFTLKQNTDSYELLKDGWNVGTFKKDAYISGFVGASAKTKLKEGLLLGVQDYGSGSVIYLSENLLFRNFWENGFLMFANALFMVGR